jgi:hypothetical protein
MVRSLLYFDTDFLIFTLSGNLINPHIMKKTVLITVLALAGLSLHPQGNIQQVITAAGGTKAAPGGSFYIGWTLGETLVYSWTAADGSLTLSAGQQSIIITAIEVTTGWDVEVSIFPNPAGSQLTIKFNIPAKDKILLYLYNANGNMIVTDKVEESVDIKQVDLEGLPPGTYFLRLVDGLRSNTYKVVKL